MCSARHPSSLILSTDGEDRPRTATMEWKSASSVTTIHASAGGTVYNLFVGCPAHTQFGNMHAMIALQAEKGRGIGGNTLIE